MIREKPSDIVRKRSFHERFFGEKRCQDPFPKRGALRNDGTGNYDADFTMPLNEFEALFAEVNYEDSRDP